MISHEIRHISRERSGIGANPRYPRRHEVITVSPALLKLPPSLPLYLKHEAPHLPIVLYLSRHHQGTRTASLIMNVFMKQGTVYDIFFYCHGGASRPNT